MAACIADEDKCLQTTGVVAHMAPHPELADTKVQSDQHFHRRKVQSAMRLWCDGRAAWPDQLTKWSLLVIAQVGDFYETQGMDAVLLVQWAGLNSVARSAPPRVSCPVANLRRTLDDLVQGAGLSVVRCEAAAARS